MQYVLPQVPHNGQVSIELFGESVVIRRNNEGNEYFANLRDDQGISGHGYTAAEAVVTMIVNWSSTGAAVVG